jgi:predicted patatin/cPLA2 family phospholipase
MLKYTYHTDGLYHFCQSDEHSKHYLVGFSPKVEHLRKVISPDDFRGPQTGSQRAAFERFCTEKRWIVTDSKITNFLYGRASEQRKSTCLQNIMMLEPFLERFQKENPDCRFRVDKDEESYFSRLLFCFSWASKLPFVSRIVAIDGAHMKDILITSKFVTEREKLQDLKIIAITTKSSNNHNILLAFSICLSEKAEEFTQIIEFCKENGLSLNRSEQTIISDCADAILKAVKDTMPDAYHIC